LGAPVGGSLAAPVLRRKSLEEERLLVLLTLSLVVHFGNHLGSLVLATWHPLVLAQIHEVLHHEAHTTADLPLVDDVLDALEVLVHKYGAFLLVNVLANGGQETAEALKALLVLGFEELKTKSQN
jgi:hypothetical protein